MKPFDDAAEKFARATDRALEVNGYVRGKLVLDMAARTIPKGSYVLDYGCGPGRLSLLLARAGFKVRGVDISAGMIAQALTLDRQGLDLEFETIRAAEEALHPATCDAILCSSVIEYVLDPDELLRGFRRALRSSGVLIISYANRSSLWRHYMNQDDGPGNPMYTPHHHAWHWPGFRRLLVRNGFRTVIGPRFFESPCDWRPWSRLFQRISLTGSLGMLAARANEGSARS